MVGNMKNLKLLVLKLLPKNLFSCLIGYIANLALPKILLNIWIKIFIRIYKIDMTDSKQKSFKTFNAFFTRELDPQARPISQDTDSIVSPVDGLISHFGNIQDNEIIQVKGISYPLENLLINKKYFEIFKNGSFITIYLTPKHYHRIHSPISGDIKELYYIPGTLFPVNFFAVENIPGLFTLNERIITLIKNEELGFVSVIKVGATVVGKIKVVYDTIESNKMRHTIHKEYSQIKISKGEELGRFEMGSTVILLFQNQIKFDSLQLGQEIFFGRQIAKINK